MSREKFFRGLRRSSGLPKDGKGTSVGHLERPSTSRHPYRVCQKGSGTRLKTVPDAEHTYTAIGWESEMIGRTVECFQRYL